MTNQNILGEWEAKGFSSKEYGDHLISIYFKDTHIANFNQSTATSEVMQDFCSTYWAGLQRANCMASQVVK